MSNCLGDLNPQLQTFTPEKSDWKVKVILDRDALVNEIVILTEILSRQRVSVVVSASSSSDAENQAIEHLQRYTGIPKVYLKALYPRRVPT